MEGFNNGGQVPAYGQEKSARQVIEELREQHQTEKERAYILNKELEAAKACSNARKNEILRLREAADELAEEVAELRSWKAQATAVLPDYPAIAKALNVPLGHSVSEHLLPGILNLLKDRHELVIQLRRLQSYCCYYVRAYQSTARYREVEAFLDKHHHSTVEP